MFFLDLLGSWCIILGFGGALAIFDRHIGIPVLAILWIAYLLYRKIRRYQYTFLTPDDRKIEHKNFMKIHDSFLGVMTHYSLETLFALLIGRVLYYVFTWTTVLPPNLCFFWWWISLTYIIFIFRTGAY